MSFSYTFTLGLKTAGETIAKPVTQTYPGSVSHDVTVNNGASNQALALTLPSANIKGVYIVSSADVTLETNDGTTPDETFTLKAGIPLLWFADLDYFANPFATDLTGLYFTNSSGQQATVQIRFLTEP